MRPRYCLKHKDKYHVNIPKKHILCFKHFISHSPKTKCPKCKVKKSTICDDYDDDKKCNITASYNFPKLRPLKCLKHRKKGMVNIKRNHILCKINDISHGKKCKLDIDKYDTSSKYMKNKIYKQYKNELIEKIRKKFKNHHHKTILQNILSNSKDKKIVKLKKIRVERKKDENKRKNKNEDNFYKCKLCSNDLTVYIDHFNTKEHIDNFNKNIEITTKKSIENKFIDIIFKFKIYKPGTFLNDLHFKKIAKQKINEKMNKNKKYKYNITFYKGAVDNMSNKLLDYKYSYNPEDIIKAININYSDRNMFKSSDAKDTSYEQQTKIRQDEINKKEKERLDNIKLLEEKKEPDNFLKKIKKC